MNCFRYLKLMSPLNAAICTTTFLEKTKMFLKNNYLTLRSLRHARHRLMVMHPHTKYNWPISKDKNVMAWTRKYYLKNIYLTWRSKVKVPQRSLRYATHRLMQPVTQESSLDVFCHVIFDVNIDVMDVRGRPQEFVAL
jgi:hypothetical protein